MKYGLLMPFLLFASTGTYAQPSIQIGPGEVQHDPRRRPELREERIFREEGGCRVTIIRGFNEAGRRTTRRVRECNDEDEE